MQAHIEEAQGPFGEDLDVEIVTCDSYFQIVIPYESDICHLSWGAFKYYVSTFGGGGGLSQNADTADALEEGGGSKPKC